MNQLNFNTKKRNFKHLSEYERGEIYAMIKLGCSISSIARHLKRSRTTIYNELKRGSVEQIKNGRKVIVYYPDAGQAQYERNRENSKKKFKALECIDFIRFVEASFKEKFWSWMSVMVEQGWKIYLKTQSAQRHYTTMLNVDF